MPAVSFSCPKCGKTLKSPQPIPAGKKIKCPACTTIFAMPAQEEELVAAKAQRSAVAARDDEEEEARPRRKAARDDEDEEERPRAASVPARMMRTTRTSGRRAQEFPRR